MYVVLSGVSVIFQRGQFGGTQPRMLRQYQNSFHDKLGVVQYKCRTHPFHFNTLECQKHYIYKQSVANHDIYSCALHSGTYENTRIKHRTLDLTCWYIKYWPRRLSRALQQYNKRAVYCMVCKICEGIPLEWNLRQTVRLGFCVSACLWLITSVVLSRLSVLHSCLFYHIYAVAPLSLVTFVPLLQVMGSAMSCTI